MTDKLNDEAARIQTLLVKMLTANVVVTDLPAERRMETAAEFLDFLGRLVEIVEGQHPTAARAAAMLYLVDSLGLDKTSGANLNVIVTLVEGMKRIGILAAELRAEKGAS